MVNYKSVTSKIKYIIQKKYGKNLSTYGFIHLPYTATFIPCILKMFNFPLPTNSHNIVMLHRPWKKEVEDTCEYSTHIQDLNFGRLFNLSEKPVVHWKSYFYLIKKSFQLRQEHPASSSKISLILDLQPLIDKIKENPWQELDQYSERKFNIDRIINYFI